MKRFRVMIFLTIFLVFLSQASNTQVAVPVLKIQNGKFQIRGIPTFLIGLSYFDAMSAPANLLQADLNMIKMLGYNSIRIWATWYKDHQPSFVSVFRPDGTLHPVGMTNLRRVLNHARNRDLVVNLTFSRDALPFDMSVLHYSKGLRAMAVALKPYRSVLFDLQNETNHCGTALDMSCSGHLRLYEVAAIRRSIKEVDPGRIVTASRNPYQIVSGRDDYGSFIRQAQVDFIATHRPIRSRDHIWLQRTDDETRLAHGVIGKHIPVLFDEPNRCGKNVDCHARGAADQFLVAAKNAKRAGAAGWFFHSDASFDLSRRSLFSQFTTVESSAVRRIPKGVNQVQFPQQ